MVIREARHYLPEAISGLQPAVCVCAERQCEWTREEQTQTVKLARMCCVPVQLDWCRKACVQL